MKRAFLALLLIVAAGLAGAGAVFTQNTLHVARRTGSPPGESVAIVAPDGVALRASWFSVAGAERCVLVLHGISDSRLSSSGFAPMFVPQGYSLLAPDSRAHGESGGDVVTYGLSERHDVLTWTRWMQTQGCTQVYGLGESLGASVLLQAAAISPTFRAIVAESAFADLQDAAVVRLQRMFPAPYALAWLAAVNGKWYARLVYGLDFNQASPLQAMASLRTPTLLIHGLADNQTPADHSRRLAAANPTVTELWLVPGAGHTSASSQAPEEFRSRVLAWFATH